MRGLLILGLCLLVVGLLGSMAPAEVSAEGWSVGPTAVCAYGHCGVGERLLAGQPVRNVGRLAAAPVRALAALRPARRAGRVAAAPFRLLFRGSVRR